MMEDKLSSNKSDVWTLSDFIKRHKDWDQRDEARLAEYLQQLSFKITQGAKNTLNELDDLVASIDDTAVQIANVNNEFQLLADKQFIENKVQEEDETLQIKVEKPVAHETNNTDTVVNNLKEALQNSFNAIDFHFEKVTVVVSDSDDDDDELKHGETILRPRTFYKKLNFPSLSGNTQSEINVDCVMSSSDSDSVVENRKNTFGDEGSLSSNEIPEEAIESVTESNINEPITQSVDTYSTKFIPDQFKQKTVTTFTDNDNDDLFNPPPLRNDYEDDLENDDNIFGNSNTIYGEKVWEDDDDDDFSNEPPLPIHSDEPPVQVIKPIIQEKTDVRSIQQILMNAELQKRFQKNDNISSTTNNLNVEPLKEKLSKEGINILGETNIKPYPANPEQNTKQATISQISKNVDETVKNANIKNDNDANKLFNDSSKSLFTSGSKDLKIEPHQSKKVSLFQQDSDDEDLFVEKKLSRNIFSDSDSDDKNLKADSIKPNPIIPHTNDNINNNSTKFLYSSSSEDDLFNDKSLNNKSIHKTTLFDTSSDDDDFFNTNKPNNNILDNSTEKKIIDSKNIFSDNEDDNYLNSNSDHFINISNIHHLENNSKAMSLSSEEFLSLQTDVKNENIYDTSSNNLLNSQKQKLLDEDTSTIETQPIFKEDSIRRKKLSILSSSDDEEVLIDSSSIHNENSEGETKEFFRISNTSFENIFDTKNQDIFNEKNTDTMSNEDSIQRNKLSILSSSDDEEVLIDSSSIHNENAEGETKEFFQIPNTSFENIFDTKNQDILNEKNTDTTSNDTLFTSSENSSTNNSSFLFSSCEDKDQTLLNVYIHKKNEIKEDSPNSLFKNVIEGKNQNIIDENNSVTIHNETFTTTENTSQTNQSYSLSNSDNDEQKLSFDSDIYNRTTESKTEFIYPSPESKTDVKESLNDITDGSSFSTLNSKDNQIKNLRGKLSSDRADFRNHLANILSNPYNPSIKSKIPKSASVVENSDESLPSSETKLYNAGKERVKIQVKRRPPSRKARLAAARMSSIDIGHESNLQESSHLFGSTSDLVDSHPSSILNATYVSNELNNKIQESFHSKLTNDDKIYEGIDRIETNTKVKKQTDLFDDDSNSLESNQEETNIIHFNENKNEKISDKGLSESNSILNEHTENELPLNKQVKAIESQTVKELKENESTSIKIQNTELSKKSNSLFDDDDNLFFSKTEEIKKTSSNLFDSDDEFEFSQKFTKTTSLKTKSIFADDSDDDLFSSTSKSSTSVLHLPKPIDNLSQQKNRSRVDGYVKLAAESVAINPLESKET